MSGYPVLMIAAVTLTGVRNQTGSRLPDLQPGDRFFSNPDRVDYLVSSGTVAPDGTAPPKPVPHMVRGVPGLGAVSGGPGFPQHPQMRQDGSVLDVLTNRAWLI